MIKIIRKHENEIRLRIVRSFKYSRRNKKLGFRKTAFEWETGGCHFYYKRYIQWVTWREVLIETGAELDVLLKKSVLIKSPRICVHFFFIYSRSFPLPISITNSDNLYQVHSFFVIGTETADIISYHQKRYFSVFDLVFFNYFLEKFNWYCKEFR